MVGCASFKLIGTSCSARLKSHTDNLKCLYMARIYLTSQRICLSPRKCRYVRIQVRLSESICMLISISPNTMFAVHERVCDCPCSHRKSVWNKGNRTSLVRDYNSLDPPQTKWSSSPRSVGTECWIGYCNKYTDGTSQLWHDLKAPQHLRWVVTNSDTRTTRLHC